MKDIITINSKWKHKDGDSYIIDDIMVAQHYETLIWYKKIYKDKNSVGTRTFCRTASHFLESFTKE